jgi:hypothetical protein
VISAFSAARQAPTEKAAAIGKEIPQDVCNRLLASAIRVAAGRQATFLVLRYGQISWLLRDKETGDTSGFGRQFAREQAAHAPSRRTMAMSPRVAKERKNGIYFH